jgi:hypothetical protein
VHNEISEKMSPQIRRASGEDGGLLQKDIAAFVRELDPLVQWESQPDDSRKGLEDRIYADYHCYGESSRVAEKYLKREVGAFLRTQVPSVEVNRRRDAQTS